MKTCNTYKILWSIVCGFGLYAAHAEEATKDFLNDPNDPVECCEDKSSLNLHKLCARYVSARCIGGQTIRADDLCTDRIATRNLCVSGQMNLNMLCTGTLSSTYACASQTKSNYAQIETGIFNNLCAQVGRIKQLEAEQARLNQICTQLIQGQQALFDAGMFNTICTQTAQSYQVNANQVAANSLCAQTGVMNNLCVNNLTAENIYSCNNYRATITFATNTTYTLGTQINWDTILDDPNGNVAFTPNGTTYTVPADGYYLFTFQMDQDDFMPDPFFPVLGVPVAAPQLLVNGVVVREGLYPFLTFTNTQESTQTAIVTLRTGDVVTTQYAVYGTTGGNTYAPITGTINMLANGTEVHESVFKIIQLTPLCSTTPPCANLCSPVQVTCQPVTIPCTPVMTPCVPITVTCDTAGCTSTCVCPTCDSCCTRDVSFDLSCQ